MILPQKSGVWYGQNSLRQPDYLGHCTSFRSRWRDRPDINADPENNIQLHYTCQNTYYRNNAVLRAIPYWPIGRKSFFCQYKWQKVSLPTIIAGHKVNSFSLMGCHEKRRAE